METVLGILKETTRRLPEKHAVVCGTTTMSFSSLDNCSDALASRLLAQGIICGDLICIILDREIPYLVAIFGILKAGGAYVPVDKEQGSERIRIILEDAKPRIIITSSLLAKQFNLSEYGNLIFSEEFVQGTFQVQEPVLVETKPSHKAYVIYTSGTTGKPKGVIITHQNLMTQVNAYHELCPVVDTDSAVLVAPFSFDVSVYEIFTSIIWGSTLHILDKNIITDIPTFVKTLIENRIAICYIPPLVIEFFSDYISRHNIMLPLRRLLVGVEPIAQTFLSEVYKKMPNGKIFNGYGPTEVTVSASAECFSGIKTDREIVSIGRALPGYKVVLLDERNTPVTNGKPGQIAIAGTGLSPGYLNDPELTKKKFVTGINSSDISERYYLTGDIAFELPDGNIEFIGRNDLQIKIKGFRVELGEIDAAFLSFPEVMKAITVVFKLPNMQKELATFYISTTELPQIRNQIREKLPAYMVPGFIKRVQEFPVTHAGKIDRSALQQLCQLSAEEGDNEFALDKGEELERIFRKNLPSTTFDKALTYYQLGGDSIGAMVLIIDIQKKYGVHLQPDWIYNYASFNALNSKIRSEAAFGMQPNITIKEDSNIIRNEKQKHFPTSLGQKVLFFLHHFHEERIIYNIFIEINIKGSLQADALKKAIEYIIQEYELLRASINNTNGKLQWTVHDTISFDLPILPITELISNFGSLDELKKSWSRIPFDLEKAPLWRFYLVEMGLAYYVLFFNVHHIVFDGWSAGIFMNTLRKKYFEYAQETTSSIQYVVENHSFRDFVYWQNEQIEQGRWDKEVIYWTERFSNLPAPLFDMPNAKPNFSEGKRYLWTLPLSIVQEARDCSKKFDTTLFVLLIAPFFLSLFSKNKKTEGTIATVYANRTISPFDKMIGYLTNIVAIHASLGNKLNIKNFIDNLSRTCITDFSHGNFPFDLLLKRTNVNASYPENPVFQVFFVFQNWMQSILNSDFQTDNNNITPSQLLQSESVSNQPSSHFVAGSYPVNFEFTETGSYSAKALLTLNCSLYEHFLEFWLEYPTDLFQQSEIAQMAIDYNRYLEIVLRQPEKAISELFTDVFEVSSNNRKYTSSFRCLELPLYSNIVIDSSSSFDSGIDLDRYPVLTHRNQVQDSAIILSVGIFLSKILQTKRFLLPVVIHTENVVPEYLYVQFEIDYIKPIGEFWDNEIRNIEQQINNKVNAADSIGLPQTISNDLKTNQQQIDGAVLLVIGNFWQKHFDPYSLVFFIDKQKMCLHIRGFKSSETLFFSSSSLKMRFSNIISRLNNKNFSLKNFTLLSSNELSEITYQWSDSKVDKNLSFNHVLESFHKSVVHFPDAIAIIDSDLEWSYSKLDLISSRIAQKIASHDHATISPVGLILNRSFIFIASVLGVLKAGKPFLPMDENWPLSRLNAIIADARPCFIFYQGNALSEIKYTKDLILDPETLIEDPYQADFNFHSNGGAPAYIIYTSGSTGTPKGVVVSHLALSAFAEAAIKRYNITPNDRILQFASLTFDAAIEEIFCSLCSGASLVLRRDQMLGSARDFVMEVEKFKVTVLDLPTAFWSQMTLAMCDEEILFPEDVRLVIIGGESAPVNTVKQWKTIFKTKPKLINTYGPTETTVVVASCYLDESQTEDEFPIGYPTGSSMLLAVDEYMNPLPDGLIGELVVAGPQVATGYLNNESTTAMKFVLPENSCYCGKRIYLTGDHVLININKQFLYRGRKDKQVKIRGFRVELDGIDNLVLKYPDVLQAFSKLTIYAGSKAIVTYVIVRENGWFESNALLAWLKDSLPEYMLPSAIVILKKFPFTPNLKIDEDALPLPAFENTPVEIEVEPTVNHQVIAGIFNMILEVKNCNSKSNFIKMGGDSLQVLSCISEIKKKTAISITIGEFYENPTIDSLANLIQNRLDNSVKDARNLPGDIVCLKKGQGGKPIIFTVFLDKGNHFLPELVDQNQSIYTFIPHGSDGEKIEYKTVTQMALYYAQIIDNHFNRNPIIIIGYSFGGLVASELAAILISRKWQIEKVILIDTYAPWIWRRINNTKLRFKERIINLKKWLIIQFYLTFRSSLPESNRNFYIRYTWFRAARKHFPTVLASQINLEVIQAKFGEVNDPLLGWDKEVGYQVIGHFIESNHHDLVRDSDTFEQCMTVTGIHNAKY
jgi:amino acid adenylation domain-containing protein